MRRLKTIGIASGLGTSIAGTAQGPSALMHSTACKRKLREGGIELDWTVIEPKTNGDNYTALQNLIPVIKSELHSTVASEQQFLVLGGDHSIAMGTWQGVLSGIESKSLGLLWIDAHLDLHTMQTSMSCNAHGMPLAALLGQGDTLLQDIYGSEDYLDPANLILIGGHSYEPQEVELARRLGLVSFDTASIRKQGSLLKVFQQALHLVSESSDRFGLSIDLDVLDPDDAPGVNTPEHGGLRWDELRQVLALVRDDPRLVGIEIAEFNPMLDQEGRTQQIICELIETVYGEASSEKRSLGSPRDGSMSTSRPIFSSSDRR